MNPRRHQLPYPRRLHSGDIIEKGYSSVRHGPATRLCRWCRTDVPKGRIWWCSEKCVQEFKLKHDWTYIKGLVWERDHGKCAICGLETEKARREYREAVVAAGPSWIRGRGWMSDYMVDSAIADNGFAAPRLGPLRRKWYEVDHIIPVVEGGSNDLTNLRTLCLPHHRQATAELAARRADKRRREKTSEV